MNGSQPPQPQPQPQGVQLLITIQPDGSINVAGPIDNKLLCYGMLEGARDAIVEYHHAKANGPSIVRANGMPPVAPRGN